MRIPTPPKAIVIGTIVFLVGVAYGYAVCQRIERAPVDQVAAVGNGIVDGVECLDVENEQIEILNAENDEMAKELVVLRKVSDDLLQLVGEYREALDHERLVRWSVEQQTTKQLNNN